MVLASRTTPEAHTMSRTKWIVLGFILCLTCGLVLPCSCEVRDGEGWERSAYSLGCVGRAIRLYHEQHGRLPPAVVRDRDGRPLYSWRVLLLPYLEDDALYQQFHLDEPWDSEHNKRLLERTPPCYLPGLDGDDAPGLTRYQVFVGPGTAFERDGLTWADFPDGLANTLLVAEAGDPVPWTKPEDLTYDPAGPLPRLGGLYAKPVRLLCYYLWRNPGFNAYFADGSAGFIRNDTDEATLRALITRNGGERVDSSQLD
jgi:hypothetical protein